MDDIDRLAVRCMDTGAQAALLEAHRLLSVLGMQSAADTLLTHFDALRRRTEASYHAQRAIDHARKVAS